MTAGNDNDNMVQVDKEYLFQLEFFVCSLNDFLERRERTKQPLNSDEIYALMKTKSLLDSMDETRKNHAMKLHQDFMRKFNG